MDKRIYERCLEYIERIELARAKLGCLKDIDSSYSNGSISYVDALNGLRILVEARTQ